MTTVDFHVHSTASDGTVDAADLVRKAEADGYSAFAITDHDNTDGIAEALAARVSLRFIPGIELSIEPGKGFDRFHLLGLGIDPENAGLKTFLRRVLKRRNERNAAILGNFAKIGIEIAADDIASYAHGEVLARPHFAQWLVRHSYASDIKSAFAKYLLADSPKETRCYESRLRPSQEESFAVIHAAGGLCVMAHPRYWRRSWRETGPDYADAERELARLREAGLDGLESLYQANTVEENLNFVRVADRTGLLKTAGSDFHGENKPTIPLGMKVPESYIAPFLERLG